MKVNVNHPTFIAFLDNVNTNIINNVKLNNYFGLTSEKKFGVQYMILKFLKSSMKVRVKLTDDEIKNFVVLLLTKNETTENYEFAQALKDILTNFDAVNTFVKPTRKNKTIKVDKIENEE